MSAAPKVIGRYELRHEIGVGGMGSVFLGYDKSLDRFAAIKMLSTKLSQDQGFVERFRREARAAAATLHPNVTQIFELSDHEGLPYFAMEYVEGKTLRDVIRETDGKIEVDEALRIALEAARGLEAAAAKNLMHRDIKPSNILLAQDGAVKVTDFGLARALEEAIRLTATDVILGTPNYVSPEQARGDEQIDFRTDMYSLGVTLYETLCGRVPFSAPKPMDVLLMQVNDPPPALTSLRKDLPLCVTELVHKMINKRAQERFSNYGELIFAIEKVREEAKETKARARSQGKLKVTKRVQEYDEPILAPPPTPPSISTKALTEVTKRHMSPYEALGNTGGLLASILYRPEVTWATLGRGPILLAEVIKASFVLLVGLIALPHLGSALGSPFAEYTLMKAGALFAFMDLLLAVPIFAKAAPPAFFKLSPLLSSLHFVVLCWVPASLLLLGMPMGILGLYTIYVAYCGLRYFFALKKGRLHFVFVLWILLFALRAYLTKLCLAG